MKVKYINSKYGLEYYLHYFVLFLLALLVFSFFYGCNPLKNVDVSNIHIEQVNLNKLSINWSNPEDFKNVLVVRSHNTITWEPEKGKLYSINDEVSTDVRVVYTGSDLSCVDTVDPTKDYYYKIFGYDDDNVNYSKGIEGSIHLKVYTYIAGTYMLSDTEYIASYWKDGQKVEIGNDLYEMGLNSYATAIDIDEDNNIYVAGYYFNEYNKKIFCYWKNGERIDNFISFPSNLDDQTFVITAIKIFNEKIYILGYCKYNSSTIYTGVLFDGTTFFDLEPIMNIGDTYAYALDFDETTGDIYIAGTSSASNSLGCIWKIDVNNSSDLIEHTYQPDGSQTLYQVVYNDSNVYSTGSSSNLSYWKNADAVSIENDSGLFLSNPFKIVIDNGNYYMAGGFINDSATIGKYGFYLRKYIQNSPYETIWETTPDYSGQSFIQGLFLKNFVLYLAGFLYPGESKYFYYNDVSKEIHIIDDNIYIPDYDSDPDSPEWYWNNIAVSSQ